LAVLFKLVVAMVGARSHVDAPITVADVALLDEAELPVYTVLVPLFREANVVNVVNELAANLARLDYPTSKLQILILCEEVDTETIDAIRAASLPGLERLRLPIPLGGTSNHFRTRALDDLRGWDPFNVNEDADLGIRAAALGHTVGVVPSTTFEEANSCSPWRCCRPAGSGSTAAMPPRT
jgi:cellulose synthase/poly-beta-1,6-N-acetylglucosamine synthase-like glycosyltransferase